MRLRRRIGHVRVLSLAGICVAGIGAVAPWQASSTGAARKFTGGFVIAASRDIQGGFTSDLYVVRSGAKPVQVTRRIWVGDDVDISPDARRVAFTEYSGRSQEPDIAAVVTLDLKTAAVRRLPRSDGMAAPAWSPTGDRLLVATARGIVTMKADGTGRRQITRGNDEKPTWSPDGRQIAFIRFPGPGLYPSAIYVARADGTQARRLTPVSRSFYSYVDVEWEVHSRLLAYFKEGDRASGTLTLTGTRHRLGTLGDSLKWYDRRSIAFRTVHGIAAVPLDGGQQRTLFDVNELKQRASDYLEPRAFDWSARL